MCISGLVVEYIVAIDVTRARFPADACHSWRRPEAEGPTTGRQSGMEPPVCNLHPRSNVTATITLWPAWPSSKSCCSLPPAARSVGKIGPGVPGHA